MAVKEITGELVKSPFRLLGTLGGGAADEDLRFIEFRAGSAELGSNATGKLTTLVAGAEQRPGLVLLLEGSWDPDADRSALKELAFSTELERRQGEAGDRPSIEVLEAFFRDLASVDALAELRARHETDRALDETAYDRDLRAAVVEAQTVDPASVEALAGARADAIFAFITEAQGGDSPRVRITDPVAAEAGSGDGWVRCRLDVAAEE